MRKPYEPAGPLNRKNPGRMHLELTTAASDADLDPHVQTRGNTNSRMLSPGEHIFSECRFRAFQKLRLATMGDYRPTILVLCIVFP
jgi:hypothetical protein